MFTAMTDTTNIDFDSFSHGQVKSKVWLCEQLEPLLPPRSRVLILGSWVNLLGFMLLSRGAHRYSFVQGIDLDPKNIKVANKICDCWNIEGLHESVVGDANTIDMQGSDLVINCSSEHMQSSQWFKNIPAGTLVCIQSSNITDPAAPWLIATPSPTLESFEHRYPLSKTLFLDTLPIVYQSWGYQRHMIIGIK